MHDKVIELMLSNQINYDLNAVRVEALHEMEARYQDIFEGVSAGRLKWSRSKSC